MPVIYLCMMLTLLVAGGCGRQASGPKAAAWRTDALSLRKELPFIKSFDRCIWQSGLAVDRSGGLVPGPSAYFIRGYVLLDDTGMSALLNRYKWEKSDMDMSQAAPPPPNQGMPSFEGRHLSSPELIQSLGSMTPYHQGIMVLSPQSHMLYFDLVQD